MFRLTLNSLKLCLFVSVCAFFISSARAEKPSARANASTSITTAEDLKIEEKDTEIVKGEEPKNESLHSLVNELNDRVTSVEQENQWLRLSESNKQYDSAKKSWASAFNAMKLEGRIHADIWSFPESTEGINAIDSGDSTLSPQDRLEIRRARFASSGRLPKDIIYKLDFEFAEASQPQFRDMYIGKDNLPILQKVILGNQKRPYGLDHLNSSNYNVFMERPFIVQAINRNNRRFGIMSYRVTEDESWNWRLGIVNLSEMQSDGLYSSDHWQMEGVGRLARTFFDSCDESQYVHLAIASSYAEPDGDPGVNQAKNEARFRTEPEARTTSPWLDTGVIDGADHFSVLALEGVINYGRWQFVGEYMNLWLNRDSNFSDDLHFHGGYAYLSCFLTDHYQPWNRKMGIMDRIKPLNPDYEWDRCGAWQVGLRWSFADLTDSDIGGGIGESLTFGLNWYRTTHARLQFNCSWGNISDHAPVDGQTSGSYVTLGTRLQIDF
jgi:phosphate-selective porin OprO and OprP